MIISTRPANLISFERIEVDYYTSEFAGWYYQQHTYLRQDIYDWLNELDGKVYWELLGTDQFYMDCTLSNYCFDFNFTFYFELARNAVEFKLVWL